MKKIISHSVKETNQIAAKLASKIKGGEIFGLIGNLGSGKTTFTQGLAKALKIKDRLLSPTFVILKEYPTEKDFSLVHVDFYRLNNPTDLESIGIFDYLGKKDKICFIEWAEKFKNQLPKQTKYIKFTFIDKFTRKIEGDL